MNPSQLTIKDSLILDVKEGQLLIKLTKEDFTNAKNYYNSLVEKKKGKRTTAYQSKSHHLNGFIFESVLERLFPELARVSTVNHDFMFNGMKVESKAKSHGKFPLEQHWDCTVERGAHFGQNPDYYIFGRITKDMEYAVIAGYMSRSDFDEKNLPVYKGSYLPNARSVAKGTTLNVYVSYLETFKNKELDTASK